jgi:hypothetical protein
MTSTPSRTDTDFIDGFSIVSRDSPFFSPTVPTVPAKWKPWMLYIPLDTLIMVSKGDFNIPNGYNKKRRILEKTARDFSEADWKECIQYKKMHQEAQDQVPLPRLTIELTQDLRQKLHKAGSGSFKMATSFFKDIDFSSFTSDEWFTWMLFCRRYSNSTYAGKHRFKKKRMQKTQKEQIAQLQKTETTLRKQVAHLQKELEKHVARAAAAAAPAAAPAAAAAAAPAAAPAAAGTIAAQSNAIAFPSTMPALPAGAAGTFSAQSNAIAFPATMPAGAAGTFAAQSNAIAFPATMPALAAGAAGTFAAQSNANALPAGAGFVRMPFPIQVPVGGIGAPTGNFISSPAMWVRTHPNCTNHN